MEAIANIDLMKQQDEQIERTMKKERGRLLNFIRQRVSNMEEAEDILQDVFSQLVETYRVMKPVEQVTAWLFTVARNRITDRFRKKKPLPMSTQRVSQDDEGFQLSLEDLLPSPEDGPEADYARRTLLEELEDAIAELPANQRDVFLKHEVEGISFNEISEETGVSVNTLLSRKRYAVLALRERLQAVYKEFIYD